MGQCLAGGVDRNCSGQWHLANGAANACRCDHHAAHLSLWADVCGLSRRQSAHLHAVADKCRGPASHKAPHALLPHCHLRHKTKCARVLRSVKIVTMLSRRQTLEPRPSNPDRTNVYASAQAAQIKMRVRVKRHGSGSSVPVSP